MDLKSFKHAVGGEHCRRQKLLYARALGKIDVESRDVNRGVSDILVATLVADLHEVNLLLPGAVWMLRAD